MKQSNINRNHNYLYITFRGPSVDAGEIDIGQAGKVLVAFEKWKRQYEREFSSDNKFSIKIKSIEHGCTDLQFVVDILQAGAAPFCLLAAGKVIKEVVNLPGVKDFLQEFGKEFGKQLS